MRVVKRNGQCEAGSLFKKILEEQDIAIEQVAALASIDVKKEERCLLEFSEKYRIPFQTYPAQKLQTVYGTFHGSDFVKSQVGVDNVCERAAMKAAGADGRICRAKQAQDGMTVQLPRKHGKYRCNRKDQSEGQSEKQRFFM